MLEMFYYGLQTVSYQTIIERTILTASLYVYTDILYVYCLAGVCCYAVYCNDARSVGRKASDLGWGYRFTRKDLPRMRNGPHILHRYGSVGMVLSSTHLHLRYLTPPRIC